MPVRVESSGPVTTIILSRPERKNAIDAEMARQLADACRGFEADLEARVAVIWGEGAVFSAGADLKALATGDANRIAPEGDAPLGPTRMRFTKPTIAAVAGHAVAGGLEIALMCDLRIAEKSAIFGVFCRRWGVPLIDGGTVRLPRLIGLSRALDMILTGRAVGADEALQFGLANRVVEDGASRTAAEDLAHEIAAFPQMCMLGDRASAYEQCGLAFDEAMRNEFVHGVASLESGDAIEGARAFRDGHGRHGGRR